jgi:phospho-N-acetylmuramoyl-pentapeptide-transferase
MRQSIGILAFAQTFSIMLYYLFSYLDKEFNFPGAGVFQYISFRALGATVTSLLIAAIFGRRIIDFLRKQQIGETIRDLGLQGQMEKKGTPTMGGFIILASLLIPVLLFAKLSNVYIVCTADYSSLDRVNRFY